MEVGVIKMSSKGQIVIPQDIREDVNFNESDKLIVYSINGQVILKKAIDDKTRTSIEQVFKIFDSKNLQITPEEIDEEIRQVRLAKHKK